jgi:ABC-type cobalamin/Fe3+-siderophores transport system ATPase subunit
MSSSIIDNSNEYALRVSNLSLKLQNQDDSGNISFELKKETAPAIVGPNAAGSVYIDSCASAMPRPQ